MSRLQATLFSALLIASAGAAHAAPVSLGTAGEFNLFSLGDFNATGGNVQGAVAVAGNLSASSYSINSGKDAYAGDAVVVGGNLSYKGGSISNGNAYVGGSSTVSNFGFAGQFVGGSSPVGFAEQAAQLKQLSTSLSGLAATGSTALQWGGMSFLGGDRTVEIFDLSSQMLGSANWGSTSHLGKGSTVILNIGGTSASLQGGLPNIFADYNVLYNFYEATSLSFNGVGVLGSVLAPWATVSGGNGQIDGNVVVANWNSNVSLSNTRSFNATEVAQFPASLGGPLAGGSGAAQAVPEPAGFALFALALALLAFTSRRKPAHIKA